MNIKKVEYKFNKGDILIRKYTENNELEIIKILDFGELYHNCFYYIHKKILVTNDNVFIYPKYISTITLVHEYYEKI